MARAPVYVEIGSLNLVECEIEAGYSALLFKRAFVVLSIFIYKVLSLLAHSLTFVEGLKVTFQT